ncbi:hypothetical protein BASA81_006451 [Batrachochytrium salamandrivorans]|nr:hypothetical protein BASA81_006451 [Batrachochytrium salamandrivorans]
MAQPLVAMAAGLGALVLLRRSLSSFSSSRVDRLAVVMVTVPNSEVGKQIARNLVENKLAACVNVIRGIESVYMWEGKVVEDGEDLLVIKTQANLLPQLSQRVHELHPYDVPEVLALPIEFASPLYTKFVLDGT